MPELREDADTRYFDDDIKAEPLAPADGQSPEAVKDPILRHKEHGKELLEMRKSLAFLG